MIFSRQNTCGQQLNTLAKKFFNSATTFQQNFSSSTFGDDKTKHSLYVTGSRLSFQKDLFAMHLRIGEQQVQRCGVKKRSFI
jgi:hypothetical protein